MSTTFPAAHGATFFGEPVFPVRRFTVEEYLRLGETGILTEDGRVELLEGVIVEKMTRLPRHDAAIDLLIEILRQLLPGAWYPRDQKVLLTGDSAPEPDVAVVRGRPADYWHRHPTARDAGLVIEVSESSLDRGRGKQRIYARAGIETYWIVNLDASRLEVFTQPDAAAGSYRSHESRALSASTSFALSDGCKVTLPLDTVFPVT